MIYLALNRELQIEQHEPYLKTRVNSGAPEELAVFVPLVALLPLNPDKIRQILVPGYIFHLIAFFSIFKNIFYIEFRLSMLNVICYHQRRNGLLYKLRILYKLGENNRSEASH